MSTEEKRKDTPEAAEMPSQIDDSKPDFSLSNQSVDVNHLLHLREFRKRTGAMAKDCALEIRNVFPKFNRHLMAACESYEKYGIIIHPDGLRVLSEKYGIPLDEPPADIENGETVKKVRKKDSRKLPRKLTFRMTDDDFSKLESAVASEGFASVQAWLYFHFCQLLKEGEGEGE
jgi:hypothetical protein